MSRTDLLRLKGFPMALPGMLPGFFLNNCDCPEDCETAVLPNLVANTGDCNKYIPRLGQVCKIYFDADRIFPLPTVDTAGITAWAAANIDNSVADNSKIKCIEVQGGIAEPTETVEPMPKDTEIVTKREYTGTFIVKRLDDLTYNFLRALQCGYDGGIFYEDLACYFYSASDGSGNSIKVKKTTVKFIKSNDNTTVNSATLEMTWVQCKDPERTDNPLATN